MFDMTPEEVSQCQEKMKAIRDFHEKNFLKEKPRFCGHCKLIECACSDYDYSTCNDFSGEYYDSETEIFGYEG